MVQAGEFERILKGVEMERSDLIKRIYETAFENRSDIRFLESSSFSFKTPFYTVAGTCYYLFDYLPFSGDMQPGMVDKIARRVVIDFKEGKNASTVADLMTAAILGEPGITYNSETVLMTIPAGTIERDKVRYAEFCRILSDNLGIVNGWPFLEIMADKDVRAGRFGNDISHRIMLNDTFGEVRDKDVLLLDDVYTTGRSFGTVSWILSDSGARSVTGVFLAKTAPKLHI